MLNLLIWVGEKTWNIPLSHVCSWIWSAITLSGNILKGTTKNLIVEFGILKKFNINIHPWKTPLPKQVLWSPPLCGWTKCNSDRAARGSPGVASREGTFRDYRGSILGCFSCILVLQQLSMLSSLQQWQLLNKLLIEDSTLFG